MTNEDAPDIQALGEEVALRFSEVKWDQFNSHDLDVRNGVRGDVQEISRDLMRIAEVDSKKAAWIWDEVVPSYVPRPLDLPESDFSPEIANTIEPGRRRRKQQDAYLDTPEGRKEPQPETDDRGRSAAARDWEKTPTMERPSTSLTEDERAERIRMLLEGLEKRYLKSEDRYHFKDQSGELAFEAKDRKLLTHHEAPGVIGSMIDLAEARGWDTLKLTGTDDFRKEAWFQARLRGLEVSGYRPTKFDQARLADAEQDRTGPGKRPNEMVVMSEKPSAKSPDRYSRTEPPIELRGPEAHLVSILEKRMRLRGDSEVAISRALDVAAERMRSDRMYVGKLVETGTAAYQDKPGAELSPYVVLQDQTGARSKVWGVDLPRALEAGGAELGADVALSFRGRQKVTVDIRQQNPADGNVTTKPEFVDRNTWEVVRLDRLERDAVTAVMNRAARSNRPALKVYDRNAPAKSPLAVNPPRQRTRQRELPR